MAILIVLALAASGLLSPAQALAGPGSEPAVVRVSILVLSAALHQTGVSDALAAAVARPAGGREGRALGTLVSAVGCCRPSPTTSP